MNLDEAQVDKVRQWIDEGRKAAEIQTRLQDELGIKMTYAEVRFLLGDLQLKPKDLPKAATPILGGPVPSQAVPPMGAPGRPAVPAVGAGPGPGPVPGAVPEGLTTAPLDGPPSGGRVAVSLDEIARPNMVVSGKVTFSDGQQAEWGIDQMGRPTLMPKQTGYRPSQADVLDFQAELEQVLGRLGY